MRTAALLLASLGVLCACAGEPPPADGPAAWATLHVGGVPVRARLARTRAQRARGLEGVTHLEDDEGMLFVYRTAQARSFWMQGCRIALDIAFLDGEGRVLGVHTLEPPRSATEAPASTPRSAPARYVLETRAGFFARHGLGAGARVRIPPTVDPASADR